MKATLDQFESSIVDRIPMGRIGEDTDMASVVLWLCGKGGSYVTGAIVPVDGGSLVAVSSL